MAKYFKDLATRTRLGTISQLAGMAYQAAERGQWKTAHELAINIHNKIGLMEEDLEFLVKRGEQAMSEEAGVVEEAVPEPSLRRLHRRRTMHRSGLPQTQ